MHHPSSRLPKAFSFAATLGIVLLSSTAAFGQQVVAEVEPNNDRTHAQLIDAGQDTLVNGKISSATDADWYTVSYVPVGECLTFFLRPNPSSNYDLVVTNKLGKVLGSSSHGTGQLDSVQVCNLAGEVYAHVKYVSGLTGNSGTYTLEATY